MMQPIESGGAERGHRRPRRPRRTRRGRGLRPGTAPSVRARARRPRGTGECRHDRSGRRGRVPRMMRRAEAEHEAKAATEVVPQVQVARTQRAAAGPPVILPGTVQPLQETAMYARANGYVRKWYVDIGTEVKKGQVLADLELPDIDQELRQARATAKQAAASISQAKSQLDFARSTNNRFSALGAEGRRLAAADRPVLVRVRGEPSEPRGRPGGQRGARTRTCGGIEELRGFGTIAAPFDGVVTMRSAEVGQLVVSGTGQGQPLFKVAEDRRRPRLRQRASALRRRASRPEWSADDDARGAGTRLPGDGRRERRESSTRRPGRCSSRSTSRTPTARSSRGCTRGCRST